MFILRNSQISLLFKVRHIHMYSTPPSFKSPPLHFYYFDYLLFVCCHTHVLPNTFIIIIALFYIVKHLSPFLMHHWVIPFLWLLAKHHLFYEARVFDFFKFHFMLFMEKDCRRVGCWTTKSIIFMLILCSIIGQMRVY